MYNCFVDISCFWRVAAALVVVLLSGSATTSAIEQPNILFILVDDLAWSDLGCYGHPWHHTPHIDSLAQHGLRFTDAYAPAPICSASRASILTGKTTARLNFEFVTKNEPGYQQIDAKTPLRAPPFTLVLPLPEVTIAEHLQRLGYTTAFFGKWHLNAHYQQYLGWSPTHGPRNQGFEIAIEDFGSHPYSWGKQAPAEIDSVGEYSTDAMIDRACDFIRMEHSQPFFLMVSQFYVHTPVKTPYRWLLNKYDNLVPAGSLSRDQRIRYAAFVETLDHYVGEVLDAVEKSGQRENTLVVFTSDNGGHPEYTANGPLRGSKWNLYEGGIRVPLIARWPGHVMPSSICVAPVIGYDLLPTFSEVAGASSSDLPLETDGVSLATAFDDPSWQPERSLIWHFPYYHPETGYAKSPDTIGVNDFAVSRTRPHSAIRRGNHKLLTYYERGNSELYNLSSDLSEQHDLSGQMPVLTEELQVSLMKQLANMHARFPQAASR